MKKILAKYKIYNIIIKIITKQLSHTSFLHGEKSNERQNRNQYAKDVSYIIDTLNNRGFKAYIVGGCIRDAILGKVPADWMSHRCTA